MKRLIVRAVDTISVLGVVLFLLGGLIGGYQAGEVLGAIVGLIVSFIFAASIFGALFVLLEMNENLRSARELLERQINTQGAGAD